MSIILGILLIVLGLLAAENLIVAKVPAAKDLISKLRVYEEAIGITGVVFGVLGFLEILSLLPLIHVLLFHILIGLASVVVMFSLGLIYGLDAMRRNLKDPVPAFILRLDAVRFKLLPYKEVLGLAAIVLGIIEIL